MKTLLCKDVSELDCSYEAEGETVEEVKAMLLEHGMLEHAEVMEAMTDDQKAAMEIKMDELLEVQE